ncbi:MAG TPA: hypothetical protein DIT18_15145 [Pseudomonas sp.]|nr:hypothetical protein [Pseudomonas sp.]
MSFFDDFLDIVKDIGTSATRMVTDTAIDLANIATAFHFDGEMQDAKKALTDVGIHSAGDAIQKRHYAFLPEMEKNARSKYERLTGLYRQGDDLAALINRRSNQFCLMVDDLDILALECSDYEALHERLSVYPGWIDSLQNSSIKLISLGKMESYKNNWQVAAKWMLGSSRVNDAVTVLAGFSGLAAAARAAYLIKTSRVVAAVRFTKVASVAGKASLVLTVVSIGLDIGLSVFELEDRQSRLESYLRDVEAEIVRGGAELDKLNEKSRQLDELIGTLVSAAGVSLIEDWSTWYQSERQRIRVLKSALISLEGAIERAEALARANQDYSHARLFLLLTSVDPSLSAELVNAVIERVLSDASLSTSDCN